MTGLEKLVKQIKEEAAASAKEITDRALSEADDIISAARNEGEEKSSELLKRSASDIEGYVHRAESALSLKGKRIILDAKQRMISNIINSAKCGLLKLPADEYFDMILKLIKKYTHKEEQGKILFSKTDKVRIPANFATRINGTLSGFNSAGLEISEETREIDGGFVLIYGDIEENCSIEALIAANMGTLVDKVNEFLFT